MNGWVYNFLRKTQKYTGTDNIYLAEGGFWLTLNQFIGAGTSFLAALAFANLLNPAIYGTYQYILSLIGMLGIFSLQGIRTAMAQAVARGLEGSFYSGFKTRLRWGSIGSLIALGLAIYYWLTGDKTLFFPLLIAVVFLPLMQASRVYSGFLAGKKLFAVGAKYNIYTDLISTAAIIAALFLTKNVFWLITAFIVSNTFLNCFFDYLTKIRFRPNKKEDPETIKYAKHLSLAGVISLMGDYLDRILLFNLAGPVQLAVYSFAMIMPEQIKGFMGNISTLAFPKLAQKSKEEIRTNLMKKFWKLIILTCAIIALYILIAPFFYEIFFPKYLSSLPYSRILVFSLLALPASLLGTVFEAKMMKKSIYALQMFSLIRIILYLVLIPLFGIWGIIMARLSMVILNSAFILFLFRRL